MRKNQWVVRLDGEIQAIRATRSLARKYAAWLRNHPACRDRLAYGQGGRVSIRRRGCSQAVPG